MKRILKNIKQEKGAVATLVLFTILMFVITLMGVYVTITTMQKSQLKSDMRIKDIYGKDVERVGIIYDEIEKTLNYEASYDYTGEEQIFEVPYTGKYKIECWGAQGGDIDEYKGGRGAYTKGEILLQKGTKLYIYVGGQGTNTDVGGYNGGGSLQRGESNFGSSGGGATDIRLVNGEWNNSEGLKSRIMVAAGGGGANNRNRGDANYMYGAGNGGAGGEIEGESGTATNYLASNGIPTYNLHCIGTGGTQTEGGKYNQYDSNNVLKQTITTGSFGNANYNSTQSGGGSGYYGGGTGAHGAAGGGSSFISGHNGCNAINSEGTHTGQSKHFSNYAFTNTQMISGSKQMPNPENNGTMVGKSGNGFVKITKIQQNDAPVIKIEGTSGENGWYTSDVSLKVENPNEKIKRITYILSGAINKEETEMSASETITISVQGKTTITIRFYDEYNNKSEKTIEIKKDSIEPKIELAENLKVNINTKIDEKYIQNNSTISDNLTTVSINNIKVKTSENKDATSILDGYDVYTISYDLKDEAGNIKQVSQQITTKPSGSKTLTNVLENAGFESELTNCYNGTPYRSSDIKRTGNYSMYYTCNNTQAFLRIKYGDVGIENNELYVRTYAKTDSETLGPGFYVYENETAGDWGNSGGRGVIWAKNNKNYVWNSWNMISKVTSPTEKNYKYLILQISQASSSGVGNVYWDDFMAIVLDKNVWEKIPSTAWLDEMIPDFTGTQTFSW